MKRIRMKGVIKAGHDPMKTCARCRAQFGWLFNKGSICPKCQHKVCDKCRQSLSKVSNTWVCVLCYKQKYDIDLYFHLFTYLLLLFVISFMLMWNNFFIWSVFTPVCLSGPLLSVSFITLDYLSLDKITKHNLLVRLLQRIRCSNK